MEKKIYIKPCLKVLLFDVEPVLGKNTIPIVSGEGEYLSKDNDSDIIWDEDEDEY